MLSLAYELSWTEEEAREEKMCHLPRPVLRTMGYHREKPGRWLDPDGLPAGHDRLFADSMPRSLDVTSDSRAASMARSWLRKELPESRVGVYNEGDGIVAYIDDLEVREDTEAKATARLIVVAAGKGVLLLPEDRDIDYNI